MKNIALLISIFFLFNINFSFAQIAGNIEDRLEESLITEYFPNYSKIKNNDNDSRIIEVLKNINYHRLHIFYLGYGQILRLR